MKIRILQNVWGNVNGYVGNKKVAAFSSASVLELREWIAEHQAKGYVLGSSNVDLVLHEEKQHAPRFYDILHDGRPMETLWAHSAEHALAIRSRKARKGATVTAILLWSKNERMDSNAK